MDLLINISMAWVTVILMVLLLIVYILRKWIAASKPPKDHFARKLNRSLRKSHIYLGGLAVITGLVHGLYSSVEVLSGNKGTLLWLLFILLGLSYGLRKIYSRKGTWMKIHRVLAVLTVVFLVLHILEVGGFVGVEPIKKAIEHLDGHDEDEEGKGLRKGPKDGSGKGASQALGGGEAENHGIIDLSGLEDGVYIGEAEGYSPGLLVEVAVSGGRIAKVTVKDHNEVNERFWGEPVEKIPLAIVEKQSTEVDIISGATYTSVGIMRAVENALSLASTVGTSNAEATTSKTAAAVTETEKLVSETVIETVTEKMATETEMETVTSTTVRTTETTTALTTVAPTTADTTTAASTTTASTVMPSTTENISSTAAVTTTATTATIITETPTTTVATTTESRSTVPEPTAVSDSIWYDGIYRGEATGFNDGLIVEVTVENGLIAKVAVVQHNEEGYHYYGRPVKEIPSAIVMEQSTNVDVVSGASYTSRGIMKAVEDALQEALK